MLTLFLRLLVAAIVAVITSGLFAGYLNPAENTPYLLDVRYLVAFLVATLVTAAITGCIGGTGSCTTGKTSAPDTSAKGSEKSSSRPASKPAASGPREKGTVKWFNVSKGFGFITRENGEDIFVHYRNIRGEGRRRLFDEQLVEFTVTTGDKGLQADDVEILKN